MQPAKRKLNYLFQAKIVFALFIFVQSHNVSTTKRLDSTSYDSVTSLDFTGEPVQRENSISENSYTISVPSSTSDFRTAGNMTKTNEQREDEAGDGQNGTGSLRLSTGMTLYTPNAQSHLSSLENADPMDKQGLESQSANSSNSSSFSVMTVNASGAQNPKLLNGHGEIILPELKTYSRAVPIDQSNTSSDIVPQLPTMPQPDSVEAYPAWNMDFNQNHGKLFVSVKPSPFERVQEMFPDFESQVVALHTELCETSCTSSAILLKPRGCSTCFCDNLCLIYDDCCPDIQLLNSTSLETPDFSLSWEEMKTLSQEKDLYTCEINHLKPIANEKDYDNYFSMINYCPHSSFLTKATAINLSTTYNADPSSDLPQTAKSSKLLEVKCENQENSSHWQYMRPLTSKQGLVYRNKFCAECHGEHKDNLTEWRTSVTCNADLLYTATSPTEAYYLALNSPGCDIRFHSTSYSVLRQCNHVNPPVISTCNQTGLWTIYDEKVERACASFTSVVKRKYKNAFCYMCNTDLNLENAKFLLRRGYGDEANIARASFYALLDFEGNGELLDDVTSSSSKEESCKEGTTRDPLNCQCREVECGQGLRVKGDNCTDVYSGSNYFGFTVCSRFRMLANAAIDSDRFSWLVFNAVHMFGGLSVKKATGFPLLDCNDNASLTADVVMEIYSYTPMHLQEMAELIFQSTEAMVNYWSTYNSVNITVTLPASNCLSASTWPDSVSPDCPTRNTTMTLGPRNSYGPLMQGVQDQMSFSVLYNTTFCPHVNLTELEFKNYSYKLRQLGMSEDSVTRDVIKINLKTYYLLCAEDFLAILTSGDCETESFGSKKAVALQHRFEDTWTVLGVMSVVCTCISLVCLLCVIVTYITLYPLRAGSGSSTLAMACLLFLAQALHELGIEQFEIRELCLVLAILIHFFWLSAVFMMTSCTLQLYFCLTSPLKARHALASRKMLIISLASSFGLSAVIIGMTMLANYFVHNDLGYPAKYLCFIHRSLSRQLGFGLPLGLAVIVNVVLFLITVTHIRRRPQINSTRQDQVSLVACFRLSVMTGSCWLSLFLLAVPGTRPWLEYVFVVLLGLQGLLLATTLLINTRVLNLWREFFNRGKNSGRSWSHLSQSGSCSGATRTTSDVADTIPSTVIELRSNASVVKSTSGNN